MKALLRLRFKQKLHERYLIELTIHEVNLSEKYPDGIKYGLICKDLNTDEFVLFDNHHPKGPHVHINKKELPYVYVNDDKLIEDFELTVLIELGVKI